MAEIGITRARVTGVRLTVGPPRVCGVDVPDALIVTCSVHGEVSEWRTTAQRQLVVSEAREHAAEAHGGRVDRRGWA